MISMLAMAAMVSCTNEIETPDQPKVNENEPVEIKLNAGVGTITTKAPVNDLTNELNVLFWRPADAGTATWETGTSIFAKVAATSGDIKFYTEAARSTEVKQYYNADVTKKSWLAGCYLGTADKAITGGAVEFTINGQDDVMATNGTSGIKTDRNGFSSFTFNHLLSKVTFKTAIKTGETLNDIQNIFGEIQSIEILNQTNALKLTLAATPNLEAQATPGSETFTLTPASGTITVGGNMGDFLLFPDASLGKTASPIKVVVKTANNTTGINVDVTIDSGNAGLAAATQYNVTLTFSSSNIAATATIGPWTNGKEGSGDVK